MRFPVLAPAAALLALASACAHVPPAAPPAPPPNILWIIGDDLGTELGCYGDRVVRTPAIDRFAAQGVRFTRAFTTAPVCSPSRSALMTGMCQGRIGAHDHRSHRDDGYALPAGVRTVSELFRGRGYVTANVVDVAPGVRGDGKTDFNFKLDRPFDGAAWPDRQPFFAEVNFSAPHRGSDWPAGRRAGPRVDPAAVLLPPCYPDAPAVRDDWANYLEAVERLDAEVAAVLKRLDDEGLAANTIVFFFSDNGRCHYRDKQWLYDGGLRIPLIVRWPGRLAAGTVRDELVSAIDITAASIALAGIDPPAGMDGRPFLGPGARPRDRIFAARDRCDETEDRIRCVRTARWKYIRNFRPELPWTQPNRYKDTHYPAYTEAKRLFAEGKLAPGPARFFAPAKPPEELYDVEADPDEMENLAADGAHADALRELRASLERWMSECGDGRQ